MKRIIVLLAFAATSCSAQTAWQPNLKVVAHKSSEHQCHGTVMDKDTHQPRQCKKQGSEEYKDKQGNWYCYSHRNQFEK